MNRKDGIFRKTRNRSMERRVTDMMIDVQHVTWKRGPLTLLNDVTWQVGDGEHWALLGLNGSGKTTLLNMITGYLWPTEGSISVLGHTYGDVDLRQLRKSIGWVSSSLQEKLYGTDRTQYVVISGKHATIGLYDKLDDNDLDQARHWMNMLGCGHLWDREYRTCSQGEKQKLLIARALMANPRILILDEPCNGLDLFSREQLLNSISALAARKIRLRLFMSPITPKRFCRLSGTACCCAGARWSSADSPKT